MHSECSFAGRHPGRTLMRLILALVLALAIRKWVVMPVLLLGDSMAPTLLDGQLGIVNKLVYLLRAPARGEIVCIWTGTQYMTKRIVGLPGEEIALHAGTLQVEGKACVEPYLEDPGDLEMLPGRIPANCYAVVGDRRSITIAAVVNRKRILGKVECASRLRFCYGKNHREFSIRS